MQIRVYINTDYYSIPNFRYEIFYQVSLTKDGLF